MQTPGSKELPLLALTATQRAIYFEGKFFGEVVNNIGGYQKYFCPLQLARFTQARDLVLNSHDVYRLRFLVRDGECYAIDGNTTLPSLAVLDCSEQAAPEIFAQNWIQQQFETGFSDLETQVFQDVLLKISGHEYWYFAKAHHLMMDGWGFALQMQRIVECYQQLALGQPPVNERPSFIAYMQGQDEYRQSKAFQDDQAYWLARHAVQGGLQLPVREDAMTMALADSRRVSRVIQRPLFSALQALAVRADGNIVAIFHALLYVYFSRAYATHEVVIGMPMHNRRSASQKQVIGSLVNVNACPVQAAADESFLSFVQRLAQQLRRDYRHSRFPIGDLLRLLREQYATQDANTHQIAFNYQKLDFGLVVDEQAVETHYLSHNRERIAATFVMCEYGEAQDIAFHLDYNVKYFDETAAQAILARLHGLLEQVIAQPEQRLVQFDLLTPQERQAQFLTWNQTANPATELFCMDQLIAEQAARTPEQIAIRSAAGNLSYRELNQQANRLAHHLLALGVQAEQMLGVYMHRTPSLLVALLAILKAGACYVPMDTQYPAARIEYILQDSAVALVLTDTASAQTLPTQVQQLNLEQYLALPAASPDLLDNPLCPGRHPAQLAYVIYTSGSTGQPKGVLLEHRNACALIQWAARLYTKEELRGVLAATSICFDLSIFEIFVPLSLGGGVILAENALSLRAGVAGEVSLINTVPSAMQALLEAGAIPASTRCINLAGELLRQDLVDAIYAAYPVRVFDLYGPSEDTTYSTFVLRQKGGRQSIGRAIDNTRAYVLDEQGNPLPTGLTGELYLGGAGLARGYLQRPELSAERFAFHPQANERLYRTGDLVRYLANGELEYVGRKDHQVKIRGYRIELGEIEAALNRQAELQASAVIVRSEQTGASLAAFLVAKPDAEVNEPSTLLGKVRDALAQSLPAYMVPAQFTLLNALPLTANGKLDRAALLAMEFSSVAAEHNRRAPISVTQRAVASLWQQVLDIPSPGLDESFFRLGGDSLLLLKLAAQLEAEFAIRVDLPALFSHVTVAQQTRWIDQQREVLQLFSQIKQQDDAPQQSYIDL